MQDNEPEEHADGGFEGGLSQFGTEADAGSAICPYLNDERVPSMETRTRGEEESVMAPITELTFDECMQLLGTGQVGRVAMSTPMGPQIIPVNYALYDGDIVFRTAPYSVLGTYGRNHELAFEIDHIDEKVRGGWSVLAVGKAHVIDDPDEMTHIRLTSDPEPWADGSRRLYLRLMVRDLTGRRVGATHLRRRNLKPRCSPATSSGSRWGG